MSTKTKLFSTSLILAASLMTAGIAQAAPQDNRCWGKIASQVAQLDGGGMGAHSRSATAAEINGGFASNGLIQQPRQGVANVSRDDNNIHNTDPADGGNGQHAVNNGALAEFLDPVTGAPITDGSGTALTCEPREGEEPLEPTQATKDLIGRITGQ